MRVENTPLSPVSVRRSQSATRCAARRRSAGGDGHALAAEVLALDHVPQLEAHVQAAVGQAASTEPADQRIGAAAAPLGHAPGCEVSSITCSAAIERCGTAAALEVGAHDVLPTPSDRRRPCLRRGSWQSPPATASRRHRVISTRNCAAAGQAPRLAAMPKHSWRPVAARVKSSVSCSRGAIGASIRGSRCVAGIVGTAADRKPFATAAAIMQPAVSQAPNAVRRGRRHCPCPSHPCCNASRASRPTSARRVRASSPHSSLPSSPRPPSRWCPQLLKRLLDDGFGPARSFPLWHGAGGHHRPVRAARPGSLRGPVLAGLVGQPRRVDAARGDVRSPAQRRSRPAHAKHNTSIADQHRGL